jgi:hypothetical protein
MIPIPQHVMKVILDALGIDLPTVLLMAADFKVLAEKVVAQQGEILDLQRKILERMVEYDEPEPGNEPAGDAYRRRRVANGALSTHDQAGIIGGATDKTG